MNKWILERIDLLSKSLSEQIKKAIGLAQSAVDSYADLQNQYDTNVAILGSTDKNTSQNISISTSFGNDDDGLTYVPEFTFLANSVLRYNKVLGTAHTDPYELVNYQTLRDVVSETISSEGATTSWVTANFLLKDDTAANASKLGGIAYTSYATKTDVDNAKTWVSTNFLSLTGTAADSAKLGGYAASEYVRNGSSGGGTTSDNSLKLGGIVASAYLTNMTYFDDFIKPSSMYFDYYSYNLVSGSSYSCFIRSAQTTTKNHPGVIEIYSKITTNSASTVPYKGIVNNTTYSGAYFYGGPFLFDNIDEESIFETALCFQLKDITNSKLICGLTDTFNPATGTATNGVWASVVNGILTGNTTLTSVASVTSTNYTLSIDTWYTLKVNYKFSLTSPTASIIFTLYSSTMESLWTETILDNIPLSQVLFLTLGIFTTSTTDNFSLIYIDYLKHNNNDALIR